jgi:hypothetical protein
MNDLTRHAKLRASQRGIPPLIVQWLLAYGEESHDRHGGLIRYFSHRSVRRLKRDVGAQPIRELRKYLGAYAVEGGDTGEIVTVGWRYRRVKS